MTDMQFLSLAESEGFFAAMISPQDIPVDAGYRKYCEENLCGHYNANYACPPACGSVQQMHEKLLAEENVLIVQTIWDIQGFSDKQAVHTARTTHNKAVMQLFRKIRNLGYEGFCSGYNGCSLCEVCKQAEGKPCAHPKDRMSCMSAYCIDVQKLAALCGLKFFWANDKLYLFGLIAFHPTTQADENAIF